MKEVISKIEKIWEENEHFRHELSTVLEKYASSIEELKRCDEENKHHRALWYEARDQVENMKGMIAGYNMQITSLEKELAILREKNFLYEEEKHRSLISSPIERIHELRNEIRIRDEEIASLKIIRNKEALVYKKRLASNETQKIEIESQRKVLDSLISYAEKLPKHRCLEATSIQGAISLLVTRKKISSDVINDELGKRLENIGVDNDKPIATTINTGGGPAIMGGKFENTDFVATKKIKSK